MSSSVRMPPPGRPAASTTCTRRPAAASRSAAASPFGPAPTTTASGFPFTGLPFPPAAGTERLELLDQVVRGRERIGLPGHDLLRERAERRRAVHVAHPLPQRGQRDGLDLAGRPLGAPPVPLTGGLQPLAVRLDLGQHLVDAVVCVAGGDGLH